MPVTLKKENNPNKTKNKLTVFFFMILFFTFKRYIILKSLSNFKQLEFQYNKRKSIKFSNKKFQIKKLIQL